jgi:hypothetical protein
MEFNNWDEQRTYYNKRMAAIPSLGASAIPIIILAAISYQGKVPGVSDSSVFLGLFLGIGFCYVLAWFLLYRYLQKHDGLNLKGKPLNEGRGCGNGGQHVVR